MGHGFLRLKELTVTQSSAQKTLSKDSSALTPQLLENLNEALERQQDEDFKAAEKLYKDAVKQSQNQPDVVNLASIFYQQLGRHKYCITLLNKTLKQHPNHPKSHQLIGSSYLKEEHYEKAIEHLNKANQLAPNNPEVLFNLGTALHRIGRFSQALSLYQKALQNQSDLVDAQKIDLYNAIADIYFLQNNRANALQILQQAFDNDFVDHTTLARLSVAKGHNNPESLEHAIQAINMAPTTDEAKTLFASACEAGLTPQISNSQLKQIIILCLNSRYVCHQALAVIWLKNFMLLTNEKHIRSFFDAQDFESFKSSFEEPGAKEILFDPFFSIGLKNIYSKRFTFEQVLIFLRTYYLQKVEKNEPFSDEEISLICALGHQCFLNEFVFYQAEDEQTAIQELKEKLEKLETIEQKHIPALIIYACYAPLTSLSNHKLLVKGNFNQDLEGLITLQIREPLEEEKLKNSIKSLGEIKNKVSQTVQQQYEENPYPRWKAESVFQPFHTRGLSKDHIAKQKVLIAGCGTGKQTVTTYHYYPNSEFTCIDISKASLAYSKRKLSEYNLDKKIKLYQCDILDVDKLNEQFDHIECCGVLHHMQDPAAGLKALVGQLKPGGKMKLALYSTLGRRRIKRAQDQIKSQGLSSSAEDIRAFRKQLIQDTIEGRNDFPLIRWKDFYSLSECRDLLFHEQEICFGLDEIQQLLEKTGLTFERMSVDLPIQNDFQLQYPEPEQLSDLSCWHQYEQDNPDTFGGMYQFTVFKK